MEGLIARGICQPSRGENRDLRPPPPAQNDRRAGADRRMSAERIFPKLAGALRAVLGSRD